MPSYKGHLAGGVGVYCVGLYVLQDYNPTLATASEWLLCVLAGSLFPDIDTKSKGQKIFYYGVLMLLLYLVAGNHKKILAFVSLLAMIPLVVNHRGLLHRTWFVVLAPASCAAVMGMYFPAYQSILFFDTAFFILGALSHLWLDLGIKQMLRF